MPDFIPYRHRSVHTCVRPSAYPVHTCIRTSVHPHIYTCNSPCIHTCVHSCLHTGKQIHVWWLGVDMRGVP